jgi:hypothetical protein
LFQPGGKFSSFRSLSFRGSWVQLKSLPKTPGDWSSTPVEMLKMLLRILNYF